jgi:hypothetical protein
MRNVVVGADFGLLHSSTESIGWRQRPVGRLDRLPMRWIVRPHLQYLQHGMLALPIGQGTTDEASGWMMR